MCSADGGADVTVLGCVLAPGSVTGRRRSDSPRTFSWQRGAAGLRAIWCYPVKCQSVVRPSVWSKPHTPSFPEGEGKKFRKAVMYKKTNVRCLNRSGSLFFTDHVSSGHKLKYLGHPRVVGCGHRMRPSSPMLIHSMYKFLFHWCYKTRVKRNDWQRAPAHDWAGAAWLCLVLFCTSDDTSSTFIHFNGLANIR